MTTLDLTKLADQFAIAMRDDGDSPHTIRAYRTAVLQLASWQGENGKEGFSLADVRGFIGSILDGGGTRNTANMRARGLRRFARWTAAEGITTGNVLSGLQVPKPGQQIVPALTRDEFDKLLSACRAAGDIIGARDEALAALMGYTGARSDETLLMDLPRDLNMAGETAFYRKAKGNRQREVPLLPGSKAPVRRYLDVRQGLGIGFSGPLWLPMEDRRNDLADGARLSYDGASSTLKRRAKAAGIEHFTLHMLRHMFAVDWFRKGGSELGLMAICGWISRDMIARYIAAAQAELAIAEARTLFT